MPKLYRACVQIDGKKVWLSAPTRKQLQDKKSETRKHLRDGVYYEKDINFTESLNEWFYNVKLKQYTVLNTVKLKETIFRNHIINCFDDRQMLKAVTRSDIQSCIDRSATCSQTVITTVYNILKEFFDLAIAEHRITIHPMYAVKKPTPPQHKKRDALTDAQLQKVLKVAYQLEQDGLIIFLLYYLGLRKNEACALKWSDIDYKTNMVHIQRSALYNGGGDNITTESTLKTKSSDRYIPLPDELRTILSRYRGLPNAYIIHNNGKLLTLTQFETLWRKIMTKCGYCHTVNKKKKGIMYHYDITPHWFRHTYITLMYDAGIPAQVAARFAGHAKYSTTANIYTHIRQERMKKEAVKLQGVFKTFAQPLHKTREDVL